MCRSDLIGFTMIRSQVFSQRRASAGWSIIKHYTMKGNLTNDRVKEYYAMIESYLCFRPPQGDHSLKPTTWRVFHRTTGYTTPWFNACKQVHGWNGSAVMLAIRRSPEVNLRNLWCAVDKAHKWGNPFWLWNHHKSQTGVLVDPQKRLMSSKNILKKLSPWSWALHHEARVI